MTRRMAGASFSPDISEVEVLPVKPKDGLLGFVSFLVDGWLFVGDVAVRSRLDGGIRLVFPVRTLPNGKSISVVHPITREAGQLIEQVVVRKLTELADKRDQEVTIDDQRGDEDEHERNVAE